MVREFQIQMIFSSKNSGLFSNMFSSAILRFTKRYAKYYKVANDSSKVFGEPYKWFTIWFLAHFVMMLFKEPTVIYETDIIPLVHKYIVRDIKTRDQALNSIVLFLVYKPQNTYYIEYPFVKGEIVHLSN